MKVLSYLVLLVLLITFVENQIAFGCNIPEKQDYCCWSNRNGCCDPTKGNRICTQALTTCCKTKIYDSTKRIYTYKYTHGRYHPPSK